MDKALKNRPGIGLLDLYFAIAIMFFVALFMLQFSLGSYTSSREAKCRQAATIAAQKKISELSLQPDAQPNSTGETETVDGVACTKKWTVTEDASSKIKSIKVTVTYTTLKGTSREVTLTGVVK
jgi:hypothetical protein